jgi:NAD-reducing hydrogenase large subunit
VRDFAPTPTAYLGTVGPDGEHELYTGKLRFVDKMGRVLQDQVDPARYLEFIAERSVNWSYLTQPYYRSLGIDEGTYRVGPLARLNVATRMKTPLAQQELLDFRSAAGSAPVHGTFWFHWARLIETLAGVEEAEQLLNLAEITGTHTRHHGTWNYAEGVGSGEAPRGTLFHHYVTDPSGRLLKVNLLIATGQNNAAMNRSITDVARQYITGPDVKEGFLNRVESAIRCYDPCLSCSTHAMGQMPREIELRDLDGKLLRRIDRDF